MPATTAGSTEPLDAALQTALANDDQAAMIALYTEAGHRFEAVGDIDAACFFLTQAFVHALETGAPELDSLHAHLARYGRVHV